MNHTILTDTEFFKYINGEDCNELHTAYNGFVAKVIELYHDLEDARLVSVALMYAEIELKFHHKHDALSEGCRIARFIHKALTFIRKMQKHLPAVAVTVPPLNPSNKEKNNTPTLKWTGNAIDLVELIYGFSEMGCINNGNIPLNELAPTLYRMFGVESKDCYRFYTDIKRRKNDSRTYFLDKMQVKLNEKMQRDDELERIRR